VVTGRLLASLMVVQSGRAHMNYEAFTNESLTMMYEGIRGALKADDAAKDDRKRPLAFGRRPIGTTTEFEREMRGMLFQLIDWSEGQTT